MNVISHFNAKGEKLTIIIEELLKEYYKNI